MRAMAILGMLTGSGALVTLGLYTFLRLETWSRILKLSAIGACIGAGNIPHILCNYSRVVTLLNGECMHEVYYS